MLKSIGGVYVNPQEVAGLDFRVIEVEDIDSEEPDAIIMKAHPAIILKSGYTMLLPESEYIEAIEKKLEWVANELEVWH